ncbi:DUF1615 family protein [Vitiosangium sp. GDMCC 1.1324]|uniref:DUF1615 family protein n=1 Tax=Vitiosangium sp. (strain GDMCC 1.1324) TaxID=2138576 RepID=UPI000D3767B3|nr:DUF1615 family protein [Vitiosangium sp. GDMCC 1.1324]PTL81536.1 DUF1615 domain-containing protein [Vitiosangium sp. GDMCC 1.1324]
MLAACARNVRPAPPLPPRVTAEEAQKLVPPDVKDREGWAQDVLAALEAHRLYPSAEAVCSVMAVIEQESGFQANPPVPGLARIVQQRLEAYSDKLGPLGPPALKALLNGKAPGQTRTFEQRLQQVKTERDLDRIFRELLEYYETEYPKTYTAAQLASALFKSTRLEDLNPITTAGSMQVSVRFAEELAGGDERALQRVREELYTRGGGVYYGAARLLGYEAHYSDPLYRFADYNAGFYTSRNAALQQQVSRLTGLELVQDGDLLAYDKQGEPLDQDSNSLKALLAFRQRYAQDLSERRVRKDVLKEKELGFEETDTWTAIKRTYQEVTGEPPEYARLPTVVIRSPKMSTERSTAWFAQSVNKRYLRCMGRYAALPKPAP